MRVFFTRRLRAFIVYTFVAASERLPGHAPRINPGAAVAAPRRLR
jgi:hypothetical protein